jgi:hypothetical protein
MCQWTGPHDKFREMHRYLQLYVSVLRQRATIGHAHCPDPENAMQPQGKPFSASSGPDRPTPTISIKYPPISIRRSSLMKPQTQHTKHKCVLVLCTLHFALYGVASSQLTTTDPAARAVLSCPLLFMSTPMRTMMQVVAKLGSALQMSGN